MVSQEIMSSEYQYAESPLFKDIPWLSGTTMGTKDLHEKLQQSNEVSKPSNYLWITMLVSYLL